MGKSHGASSETYIDQDSEPTANSPDDVRPAGPTFADERPPLVRWIRRVEEAEWLDAAQRPLYGAARRLVSNPRRRDILHGREIGHALHPLLTDLPLGFWTSSTVLDVVGGRHSRTASRRLLALGMVTALPTAVTGLAEWAYTSGRDRRVGVAHAGANVVVLVLYGASLAARYRSRHSTGVLLGLAGGGVAIVSGYLGGHLTLARKVSSRHPAFTGRPDNQTDTEVPAR